MREQSASGSNLGEFDETLTDIKVAPIPPLL